uniref:Uncharacterized protein n=1 Tax=Vespula pensylvanica TaxID=30213 RepID=A0A834PA88_VESPE|nr:hypothetical protein H0235_002646 [Vespula pensylvanica]
MRSLEDKITRESDIWKEDKTFDALSASWDISERLNFSSLMTIESVIIIINFSVIVKKDKREKRVAEGEAEGGGGGEEGGGGGDGGGSGGGGGGEAIKALPNKYKR